MTAVMSSPLFTADALRAMRDVHASMLTSRAQIDAPRVASQTGQGGANVSAAGRSWQTATDPSTGAPAIDVPCRMAPLTTAVDGNEADQSVNINRWVVAFDLEGPPVREGYRLTIAGTDAAGQPWSRLVLVIGSRTPRTYSAMRTFVCQDVGPGMSTAAT